VFTFVTATAIAGAPIAQTGVTGITNLATDEILVPADSSLEMFWRIKNWEFAFDGFTDSYSFNVPGDTIYVNIAINPATVVLQSIYQPIEKLHITGATNAYIASSGTTIFSGTGTATTRFTTYNLAITNAAITPIAEISRRMPNYDYFAIKFQFTLDIVLVGFDANAEVVIDLRHTYGDLVGVPKTGAILQLNDGSFRTSGTDLQVGSAITYFPSVTTFSDFFTKPTIGCIVTPTDFYM